MHQSGLKSRFGWKIGGVLIVGVIALFYTLTSEEDTPQATPAELRLAKAIAAFDPRLLSCNEVTNAEPTDAFNTCAEVAKEGFVNARHRLIWAYSRADEHQNWQEVFGLLKSLPTSDKNAQLLQHALMHLMGDSDELKLEGEEGIKRLVHKNYAPANVILASIYALGQNQRPPSSNILWLLRKAALSDPTVMDPTTLSLIYANQINGQGTIEQGAELLKESADDFFPVVTNNVAWFLATIDENPFHPTDYAVKLASAVVNNEGNENNPIYIDTLAAAYARNGEQAKAIETQEKALTAITSFDWSDATKQRVTAQYENHLAMYKAGNTLVEYELNISLPKVFNELKMSALDGLFRQYLRKITDPSTLKNNKDDTQPATD